MAEYHGEHTVPADARFGIVVARFNAFITRRLLDGCREGLRGAGASDEAIDVAWVPGAFEIATVARQMALSDRYDGPELDPFGRNRRSRSREYALWGRGSAPT